MLHSTDRCFYSLGLSLNWEGRRGEEREVSGKTRLGSVPEKDTPIDSAGSERRSFHYQTDSLPAPNNNKSTILMLRVGLNTGS